MRQFSLMLKVPEVARADVMLSADRVYYRFTTVDESEDGDLPGLKDRYLLTETRLREALQLRPGEEPDTGLRVDLFVDNMKVPCEGVSRQGVRRAVDILLSVDEAFAFMKGFV